MLCLITTCSFVQFSRWTQWSQLSIDWIVFYAAFISISVISFVQFSRWTQWSQLSINWIVFYATFNSISVISRRQLTLFMAFLGFTSTRLWLWSILPKDTPTKNSEDPVQLEPRTPGLRVKLFTTEPCRTLSQLSHWAQDVNFTKSLCLGGPNLSHTQEYYQVITTKGGICLRFNWNTRCFLSPTLLKPTCWWFWTSLFFFTFWFPCTFEMLSFLFCLAR